MSRFEEAIKVTLPREGRFVNHPKDPGGATNWGVSLRYLETLGWIDEDGDGYHDFDFDRDGDVDPEDIRLMPQEAAIEIYQKNWWERYMYSRIVNQEVATKVFDTAVNMGPVRAHKILQRAIYRLGLPITIDGKLGPQTFSAVNRTESGRLVRTFQKLQAHFYLDLIAKNPSLAIFKRGWLNRAYDRI